MRSCPRRYSAHSFCSSPVSQWRSLEGIEPLRSGRPSRHPPGAGPRPHMGSSEWNSKRTALCQTHIESMQKQPLMHDINHNNRHQDGGTTNAISPAIVRDLPSIAGSRIEVHERTELSSKSRRAEAKEYLVRALAAAIVKTAKSVASTDAGNWPSAPSKPESDSRTTKMRSMPRCPRLPDSNAAFEPANLLRHTWKPKSNNRIGDEKIRLTGSPQLKCRHFLRNTLINQQQVTI